MKKKAMIMAVASLGSMALIGTGFAGWVISANTETKASGVITAYDVQDQRLKVTEGTWKTPVSTSDKSGKIVYGKPATTEHTTYNWFSYGTDVDPEVLTNEYTFTVASGDANDKAAFTVTPTLAIAEKKVSEQNVWESAKTAGIVADPVPNVTSTVNNLNGVTGVEVKISVTFAWGAHFTVGSEVKNPYFFYNEKEVGAKIGTSETQTKTWGDDAAEFMHKFADLDKLGFTLNIAITRNK